MPCITQTFKVSKIAYNVSQYLYFTISREGSWQMYEPTSYSCSTIFGLKITTQGNYSLFKMLTVVSKAVNNIQVFVQNNN